MSEQKSNLLYKLAVLALFLSGLSLLIIGFNEFDDATGFVELFRGLFYILAGTYFLHGSVRAVS